MGTISKASPANLSLKERLNIKKQSAALLCDISGSMNSDVEPGHTKIQALRDIVSNIQGPVRVFAFSDNCIEVTKSSIPNPTGGTYMSRAIREVKHYGIKKMVMITDGADAHSDENSALAEAKDIELQILYVGPGPKPEFLDRLASAGNGGFCIQEDLTKPKELENKLTLLLNAGEINKGSIEL